MHTVGWNRGHPRCPEVDEGSRLQGPQPRRRLHRSGDLRPSSQSALSRGAVHLEGGGSRLPRVVPGTAPAGDGGGRSCLLPLRLRRPRAAILYGDDDALQRHCLWHQDCHTTERQRVRHVDARRRDGGPLAAERERELPSDGRCADRGRRAHHPGDDLLLGLRACRTGLSPWACLRPALRSSCLRSSPGTDRPRRPGT